MLCFQYFFYRQLRRLVSVCACGWSVLRDEEGWEVEREKERERRYAFEEDALTCICSLVWFERLLNFIYVAL